MFPQIFFVMKWNLILIASFSFLAFTNKYHGSFDKGELITKQSLLKQVRASSAGSIKIINNSSLKHLPHVIADLSLVLDRAEFLVEGFLCKNGFTIYLNDVRYKSFEVSASVMNDVEDATYHVKLNRFNRQASDKALAATLIHEIMHCVLLDIYRNAIQMDNRAHTIINGFDEKLKHRFPGPNHNFFYLMNSGEDAQHEVMYHLLYPEMVSLLIKFAKMHKAPFVDYRDPELLMWSGLQKIAEYETLTYDERKDIETAILREKGLPVDLGD